MPRIPVYNEIVEKIIKEIENHTRKPGDKLEAYPELAKTYGRSLTTIIKVVAELRNKGYLISKSHQNLVQFPPVPLLTPGSNHQVLCVFMPESLKDPFWAAVAEGILSEVTELRGEYSVIIYSIAELSPKETKQLLNNIVKEFNISGLICIPPYNVEGDTFTVQGKPLPTVYVDRYPIDVNAPKVIARNREGANQAINYLFNVGCRRFLVLPEGKEPDGRARFEIMGERIHGCEDAFACLAAQEEIYSDIYNYTRFQGANPRFPEDNYGYRFGRSLFNRPDVREQILDVTQPPIGIFCLQDSLTLGMWRAIQELEGEQEVRQMRKPLLGSRIALMSFDNTPMMEVLGISSMVNPAVEMGRKAVQLSDRWLKNPLGEPPEDDHCDVVMVRRFSTDVIV